MSFLLPLGIVYLAKDIDWTDETNCQNARLLFFGVHVTVVLIYWYIKRAIVNKNDRTAIAGSEETVLTHDLAQINKQLTNTFVIIGLMTFLNYKFEAYVPLLMQSVLNPVNLYKHKLFRCYILGENTPEINERPWKEASPFSAMLNPEATPPTPSVSEEPQTEERIKEVVDDDENVENKETDDSEVSKDEKVSEEPSKENDSTDDDATDDDNDDNATDDNATDDDATDDESKVAVDDRVVVEKQEEEKSEEEKKNEKKEN